MSNCGIYRIRNTRNDKFYIGSTKDFDRRKSEHFAKLNMDKHEGPKLQNAYNKEKNKDNFVFDKLIICSPDMLLFYEQLFLDALAPSYNASKIAGRISLTPEMILKRASSLRKTLSLPHQQERLKDRISGDKNPSKRPEVRKKIAESSRAATLSRGDNHHMKQLKHRQRMRVENPGMRLAHRKRMTENNPSARAIIELSEGRVFNTMKEAAIIYGADLSHIVKVCKGKRKSAKGHVFAYLESA